jgi:hypothetical protein
MGRHDRLGRNSFLDYSTPRFSRWFCHPDNDDWRNGINSRSTSVGMKAETEALAKLRSAWRATDAAMKALKRAKETESIRESMVIMAEEHVKTARSAIAEAAKIIKSGPR